MTKLKAFVNEMLNTKKYPKANSRVFERS